MFWPLVCLFFVFPCFFIFIFFFFFFFKVASFCPFFSKICFASPSNFPLPFFVSKQVCCFSNHQCHTHWVSLHIRDCQQQPQHNSIVLNLSLVKVSTQFFLTAKLQRVRVTPLRDLHEFCCGEEKGCWRVPEELWKCCSIDHFPSLKCHIVLILYKTIHSFAAIVTWRECCWSRRCFGLNTSFTQCPHWCATNVTSDMQPSCVPQTYCSSTNDGLCGQIDTSILSCIGDIVRTVFGFWQRWTVWLRGIRKIAEMEEWFQGGSWAVQNIREQMWQAAVIWAGGWTKRFLDILKQLDDPFQMAKENRETSKLQCMYTYYRPS